MPTDISNAVGTARQFTPQPDSQYQGRYQSIGAGSVAARDTSRSATLAANIERLNVALQSYAVSHEKYLDDMGAVAANKFINAKEPEDLKKLNIIDAAQQEGYANVMDNPYFMAHAEDLRGQLLAKQLKTEYDNQFAMTPARSMAEEQERYNKFVSDWREANLTGVHAPANLNAFNKGFYEAQPLNMLKLTSDWTQKKYKEDVLTTMASAQSKLGDVIENSVELLKTNGAMTQAVQEVFNEARLMGLPPEYRAKLLDDFATQIIQTGHLDAERLEQMMDNITIQTSMDGSTTKASDLLNMQTYKTYAVAFQKQFMDKWKWDTINKFGKMGKKGIDEVFKAQAWVKEHDPDNAPIWAEITPAVITQVKREEEEKKANARAMLAARKQAGATAIKSQNMVGAINTWLNGGTMYNGQTISSLSIDKEELNRIVPNMLQGLIAQGDVKKAMRLMDMPQMNTLRNDIGADVAYKLDCITPDNADNVDQSIISLLQFTANNPNSVERMFGSEVGNRASVLRALFDLHNGDIDATVKDFAVYNSADKTVKDDYKQQAHNIIMSTGYTAGGVTHLTDDDGGTNSYYPSTSINIAGNPEMEGAVTNLATLFCLQGLSPWDAVNKAGATISNNYLVYHTGAFPKGVALDNCYGATEWQNEVYFRRALADKVLENSPEDGWNVNMTYRRETQTFVFTNEETFNTTYVPLSDIRKLASDKWSNDMQWNNEDHTTTSANSSSDYDVNSINEQRLDTSNTYTSSYGSGLHRPI